MPDEKTTALALPMEFDELPLQIPDDADLPLIGVSRETAQFELPNGEYVKKLTGHVLAWNYANTYFATRFEDKSGTKQPTCLSPNGKQPAAMDFDGYEIQSKVCEGCPKNQFGTGKEGIGKACQNSIRLFVLFDDDLIPCQIRATASSLGRKKPLSRWLFGVANDVGKEFRKVGIDPKHVRIMYARAEFTLDAEENDRDLDIAVLHPKTIEVVLDKDRLNRIAGAIRAFKHLWDPERLIRSMAKEANEVQAATEAQGSTDFAPADGGDDWQDS
jgi:hypothetical protein